MQTKEEIINNINCYYDSLAINAEDNLKDKIEKELQVCGIMCRVFSRKKSKESTLEKMEKKADTVYSIQNKKMQDLVGIRIVLYFKDDIDICIGVLKTFFNAVGCEHDRYDVATFKPQRINYVFEIPDELDVINSDKQKLCLIDNTFEVQIRTIFSEGWHEVEHDIRYKFLEDWENVEELSREFNGLFAVLEMCDNNIISLCDKMAYFKYKEHAWEAMIRNKFRLKFQHDSLCLKLKELLDRNPAGVGKEIFRFSRKRLVDILCAIRVPKTCDNVVYLINAAEMHREEIYDITPDIIMRKYANYEETIKGIRRC